VLRSIPISAKFSSYGIGKIEIRGEALINKESFRKLNEKRVEEGEPPLANARNSASGGLRQQDPKLVAERKLEAFLYHVSVAEDKNGNDLLGTQTPFSQWQHRYALPAWFQTPHNECEEIGGNR
jgi:DNA ligase (NAD+)